MEKSTCTHVRFKPSTSAAVNAGIATAYDCELFETSLSETRQCTPDTIGQITARLCSEEPLCHVGCGDIEECGANALNDYANIAVAGGPVVVSLSHLLALTPSVLKHVIEVGCPRERFLAITSETVSGFLQAVLYSY